MRGSVGIWHYSALSLVYSQSFHVAANHPSPTFPTLYGILSRAFEIPKFAVGLAKTADLAMPIYFDPLPPGSHDSVNPCSGFGRPNSPLTRVLQTLKLIKAAFSSASANDKKNIEVVINAIMMIHGTRTESGVYRFIVGTDLHTVVPITLSAQQCNFILELFKVNVTENSELSIVEKMQLEPILLQVLYVTLWGAVKVVRNYKDNNNQVRIPDLLKKYDVVYLRGCDGE